MTRHRVRPSAAGGRGREDADGVHHRLSRFAAVTNQGATYERADCDEVVLDLPLGREGCRRYVVRDGDEVTTFWFAKARAGMPVEVVSQRGGRVVSTSVRASGRVDETPPDPAGS